MNGTMGYAKPAGQGFIRGALVLTFATMLVKVIGMFYKIPLGNLLGAAGMSYFQTAYSIFSPVYALSIAGFPAAISKMVSESAAAGRYREVRRIWMVAMALLTLLGLAGFGVLFFGAGRITSAIGNPQARLAVLSIAPSIFFCCIMAVSRGYYQGLGNMNPTAASQVLEALAKLVCGIGFAWYFLQLGLGQYERGGTVFGVPAGGRGEAELLALPYAAAGAILGVSVSTLAGSVYLLVRHAVRGDGMARKAVKQSAPPRSSGAIAKSLVAIALPICMASLISHVTNLVDVVTIMHRVGAAMERDGAGILETYRGLLPAGLTGRDVPSFLYGAYGYAVNIFNLVPALTVAFGISALPMVASRWAVGEKRLAAQRVYSVIKLTALLAIPAGLGIAALAQPILELLYPARLQEAAIAAPLLRTLGISAVFVGVATPINSVFQAIGKARIPVGLMAVGALLKTGANYFLVAIPALNIRAVPYGTLLCYAFILFAGIYALEREMLFEKPLLLMLLKPLLCGIACAAAANASYGLLSNWSDSRLVCLLSIVIGGSIYGVFVLFFRIISKNEAILLPNGKKVAKILEKLSFLG